MALFTSSFVLCITKRFEKLRVYTCNLYVKKLKIIFNTIYLSEVLSNGFCTRFIAAIFHV
jgi:hypothetical protein